MNPALGLFEAAQRKWRRTDRLVRAMIANWLGGMGVGLVCAIILLVLDFDGIRTLLWRSDMAVAGTLLLCVLFALTFGGLVCAASIMNLGSDDDDEPRGGRRAPRLRELRPIRVSAQARRAR